MCTIHYKPLAEGDVVKTTTECNKTTGNREAGLRGEIIKIEDRGGDDNNLATVRWDDGHISYHDVRWLQRISMKFCSQCGTRLT
jgi:hypothetical protein